MPKFILFAYRSSAVFMVMNMRNRYCLGSTVAASSLLSTAFITSAGPVLYPLVRSSILLQVSEVVQRRTAKYPTYCAGGSSRVCSRYTVSILVAQTSPSKKFCESKLPACERLVVCRHGAHRDTYKHDTSPERPRPRTLRKCGNVFVSAGDSNACYTRVHVDEHAKVEFKCRGRQRHGWLREEARGGGGGLGLLVANPGVSGRHGAAKSEVPRNR